MLGRGSKTADAQSPDAGNGNGNTPTSITAAKVRELYAAGCRDVASRRRNYLVNSCFVDGEQNIRWVDRTASVDTLPEFSQDWTPVIDNRMWPATRTLVAKLLRRPLVFEVPPQTGDDSAVNGARKALAALGDVHRRHNWEGLRRDHVFSTWLGGTGALAVEWDPADGQDLGVSDETGKPFGTGEIKEWALSIDEIATEPGTRDIERARYWIRPSALPPGEVQELLGLDYLPEANASPSTTPLEAQMSGGSGDKSSLCLVLNYYERPNGKRPGQIAVVVGEKVVDSGPWPFPFKDRLNLCVARETPARRHWAGKTVLSAAVSPQQALNGAQSAIDEHMHAAGNARLVVEDGSIDDEDWDDDPASIVKMRPGTQRDPAYLAPPTMPSWWSARPGELRQAIDDTLNVHDISRGEASGAGSGVALSLLAENDDTPLGAFSKELAECWGRFGSLVLEIYADKVTETRTARVDHASAPVPELLKWTGKDFAGQTVAVVPQDAVAPTSRAGQLQKGLLLLDKLVFGPPGEAATTRRFLEFVDLPGGADLEDAVDADVAKAQVENYRMSLAEVQLPADFDLHAAHITEHNRDRKSESYRLATPEIQALKDQHIAAHETLAAEEMGKQMAKAIVDPALATAAQAHEPPLAGDAVPPTPALPPDPDAAPGYPVPAGTAGPPPTPPTQITGQ